VHSATVFTHHPSTQTCVYFVCAVVYKIKNPPPRPRVPRDPLPDPPSASPMVPRLLGGGGYGARALPAAGEALISAHFWVPVIVSIYTYGVRIPKGAALSCDRVKRPAAGAAGDPRRRRNFLAVSDGFRRDFTCPTHARDADGRGSRPSLSHATYSTHIYAAFFFFFFFFGNRQTGSCPPLLRQDTALPRAKSDRDVSYLS
jgi:hypothetical protein